MPIIHAIAHRLQLTAEGESQLQLREQELPREGGSETLLDRLKSSFLSRISREHGSFAGEGEPSPLQQLLDAVFEKDTSFVEQTGKLAERLLQLATEEKALLDCHLCCYEEKGLDHHQFHLFCVSQSPTMTLDESLNVVTRYQLDTGPSLFGIKVDLAEWRERKNYAYLSLLPPRGNQGLAAAFSTLTGFSNGLNKQEATLAFLEGVEAFARELPGEKVDDYRNRVVDYCMERESQDAPVELRGLAGSLDEIDGEAFVRTIGEHTGGQSPELMLDRRSLKRYVKFTGREKDLAISFNSYQLNRRVTYDVQSDTLSIEGIPSALRKQLLEHLENRD